MPPSDERNSREGADAALYVLARGESERVSAYLQGGRRFEHLTGDQLALQYKEGLKLWASDVFDIGHRALLDDAGAEFALREITPPVEEEAEAYAKKAIQQVAKAGESMTKEQNSDINRQIMQEYRDGLKRRN